MSNFCTATKMIVNASKVESIVLQGILITVVSENGVNNCSYNNSEEAKKDFEEIKSEIEKSGPYNPKTS